MAEIMAIPQSGKVSVFFQTGLNERGTPIIRSRTYGNVNSNAADEELYEVGQALGSLMKDEVTGITRIDVSDLITV
ncbi:MAG: DUF1659 domain-containing protein [Sporomusaceae bacterium]|jgi:hypothetical protein|nr:DUF1659 domain-containing protein [Sporomusaceae bacterium]